MGKGESSSMTPTARGSTNRWERSLKAGVETFWIISFLLLILLGFMIGTPFWILTQGYQRDVNLVLFTINIVIPGFVIFSILAVMFLPEVVILVILHEYLGTRPPDPLLHDIRKLLLIFGSMSATGILVLITLPLTIRMMLFWAGPFILFPLGIFLFLLFLIPYTFGQKMLRPMLRARKPEKLSQEPPESEGAKELSQLSPTRPQQSTRDDIIAGLFTGVIFGAIASVWCFSDYIMTYFLNPEGLPALLQTYLSFPSFSLYLNSFFVLSVTVTTFTGVFFLSKYNINHLSNFTIAAIIVLLLTLFYSLFILPTWPILLTRLLFIAVDRPWFFYSPPVFYQITLIACIPTIIGSLLTLTLFKLGKEG